jgi:phosphoribosyl 1,2-cyclic phosphodiesterase
MESMGAKKHFHRFNATAPLQLGDLSICNKKMNHPGDSFSYKITEGERSLIFATDTELSTNDFQKTEENVSFFNNADCIILDSQYTLGEAIEKYNWGHSAFSLAVDFAANWGIKQLVLFHHDPTYDDRKLFNMLQSARWYTDRIGVAGIEIFLALEGMEINL